MLVVRNLPEQLILVHAPWALGGFLIACIIGCSAAGLPLLLSGEISGLFTLVFGAGLPLTIFALAVKRNQAIFDGSRGTITLQRRSLWRYEQQVLPLARFRGPDVQRLADSARTVLMFDGRKTGLPMVEAHASLAEAARTAALIQAWHAAWRTRQGRPAHVQRN